MRALGGAAVGLPCFRLLERSASGATDYPLRLLTLFTPHGTWLPYWRPHGTETDFTMVYEHSMLTALEPFKQKLLVIDGLDHRIAYESGGTGHGAGSVVPFTGAPQIPNTDDSMGPSIEQFLATKLGGSTTLPSIQLGVGWSKSLSFTAAGKRLPSENRPWESYRLVFGDGAATPGDTAAATTLQNRLGVVNALKAELDALRVFPRLAAEERTKLDEHMTALDDMGRRLNGLANSKACTAPTPMTAVDNPDAPDFVPAVSRAQIDVLTQAFACDITRFAALSYHGQGSEAPMPYAGVNLNTHLDVAHQVGDGKDEANLNLVKVHQWYAGEVAYLLQSLDAIKEGDGTLLDHTMIVWSNELGNPAVHDHFNVPFVVAGGTNGKFRMGRYAQYDPIGGYDCQAVQPTAPGCSADNRFAHLDAHNALLVAILQAFGQDMQTFNAPAYSGALPGILACFARLCWRFGSWDAALHRPRRRARPSRPTPASRTNSRASCPALAPTRERRRRRLDRRGLRSSTACTPSRC